MASVTAGEMKCLVCVVFKKKSQFSEGFQNVTRVWRLVFLSGKGDLHCQFKVEREELVNLWSNLQLECNIFTIVHLFL